MEMDYLFTYLNISIGGFGRSKETGGEEPSNLREKEGFA